MSRRLMVLPTLAVAALVAGCGGGSTEQLSPFAKVQAAGDITGRAGASDFELSTDAKGKSSDITVKAIGSIDHTKRRGQITVTLGGIGSSALSIDERYVGDNLYISVPAQPGTYYKVSLAALVGTSLASGADPTAGFQAMKAVSNNVTTVGTEQIRGVETTHFRGTIDAKAALALVGGATKQLLSSAIHSSDLSSIPFDAYLDSQGRVRRFIEALTVTAPGSTDKVRTTTTVELYNFGVGVNVTAPPAAEVKDGSAIVNALKHVPSLSM